MKEIRYIIDPKYLIYPMDYQFVFENDKKAIKFAKDELSNQVIKLTFENSKLIKSEIIYKAR